MRLIDADALPKYTGYALSANEVAEAVENAPTIDAVPVVRCRECKYFLPEWPGDASSAYQCHKGLGWPEPDGYCYKGKQKDGAN